MGWRLVAEILDHCPDIKYREFRILIALALDARDETRQGMPGHELLTLRGNCGIRTTQRAMRELTTAGLVKMTSPPAPGRRAVWEILPLATHDTMLSPVRTTEPNQRTTKTSPTHDTPLHGAPSVNISSHRPKSSLSRARAALEAAGAAEREIDFVIGTIKNNPKIKSPAAYLRSALGNGDAAELIAGARAHLAETDRADAERQAAAQDLEHRQAERARTEADRARTEADRARAWQEREAAERIELAQWREDHDFPGPSVAEVMQELEAIRSEQRSIRRRP
jgi:hypothetical protein